MKLSHGLKRLLEPLALVVESNARVAAMVADKVFEALKTTGKRAMGLTTLTICAGAMFA